MCVALLFPHNRRVKESIMTEFSSSFFPTLTCVCLSLSLSLFVLFLPLRETITLCPYSSLCKPPGASKPEYLTHAWLIPRNGRKHREPEFPLQAPATWLICKFGSAALPQETVRGCWTYQWLPCLGTWAKKCPQKNHWLCYLYCEYSTAKCHIN